MKIVTVDKEEKEFGDLNIGECFEMYTPLDGRQLYMKIDNICTDSSSNPFNCVDLHCGGVYRVLRDEIVTCVDAHIVVK